MTPTDEEFQQILYLAWLITVYQRQLRALLAEKEFSALYPETK